MRASGGKTTDEKGQGLEEESRNGKNTERAGEGSRNYNSRKVRERNRGMGEDTHEQKGD